MRLFIRDHAPLVAIQIVQLSAIFLVLRLDGYRNAATALYALFLAAALLTGYLVFRYASLRGFYRRLSDPLESLDASVSHSGYAPLAEAADELLKEQYRRYMERLKDYEQKQREHLSFMNQWAHQMKTPLSVIHLTAQDRDDPRLVSILEEADRLERGLETVLAAARLDSFDRDFRVEQTILRKIAEKAIHEHKRLFIRRRVYPALDIDPALRVQSDPKWLAFALGQLVNNAIKYSDKPNASVTVAARMDGASTVLEVRDEGVGIPPQDLKRVFQPSFTGENGRTFHESTGMGLYLAHEICSRLGHAIEIESAPGAGTTVRIRFLTAL